MGTQVWTPKTGTLPDTTTTTCSSPTNWSNSARNHLKVAVQRSSIAIRAKCSYECLRNGFPGDISVQSLTGKVCVLNRQRVSCGKDGRSSLKSSTAWETTPLRRSTRSNFGQRRSVVVCSRRVVHEHDQVGGSQVWSRASSHGDSPPRTGWRIPWALQTALTTELGQIQGTAEAIQQKAEEAKRASWLIYKLGAANWGSKNTARSRKSLVRQESSSLIAGGSGSCAFYD